MIKDVGLEGSLPATVLPAGLRTLQLSGNKINGSIPADWALPVDLLTLELSFNQLTGPISGFTLPSKLQTLGAWALWHWHACTAAKVATSGGAPLLIVRGILCIVMCAALLILPRGTLHFHVRPVTRRAAAHLAL